MLDRQLPQLNPYSYNRKPLILYNIYNTSLYILGLLSTLKTTYLSTLMSLSHYLRDFGNFYVPLSIFPAEDRPIHLFAQTTLGLIYKQINQYLFNKICLNFSYVSEASFLLECNPQPLNHHCPASYLLLEKTDHYGASGIHYSPLVNCVLLPKKEKRAHNI